MQVRRNEIDPVRNLCNQHIPPDMPADLVNKIDELARVIYRHDKAFNDQFAGKLVPKEVLGAKLTELIDLPVVQIPEKYTKSMPFTRMERIALEEMGYIVKEKAA